MVLGPTLHSVYPPVSPTALLHHLHHDSLLHITPAPPAQNSQLVSDLTTTFKVPTHQKWLTLPLPLTLHVKSMFCGEANSPVMWQSLLMWTQSLLHYCSELKKLIFQVCSVSVPWQPISCVHCAHSKHGGDAYHHNVWVSILCNPKNVKYQDSVAKEEAWTQVAAEVRLSGKFCKHVLLF